jgi:hypothetical protein
MELQAAKEEELEQLKEANKKKRATKKPPAAKKAPAKKAPAKKAATAKKAPAKKKSDDNNDDDDADDAFVDDDDGGVGHKRGTNLTPTDRLMICKAYIATSEDPIHGNKIGSSDFCEKLAENFRLLYQAYIDQLLIQYNQKRRESDCSSSSNSTVGDSNKMPITTFCDRPGKSLWRQFGKIGNECTKFYSVEKQSGGKTLTSGENFQTAHERHLELFLERHGKAFCCWECAEYLRHKPKWQSVLEKKNAKKKEGKLVKTERPVGKKRATKDKEKHDLVESIAKSAISEIIEQRLGATKKQKVERDDEAESFFAARKQYLAEASAGLQLLLRDATMEKVLAKANTPDKIDWQKKQAAIAMCEMEARSKHAILKMEKNELHMKLEMEKNELQMKLDIAKLKLELETIENNKNKENLN